MKWNGRNYRPAGQYIRHSKNNKEFNFEDALKPLGEKENKGNVWVPVKQVIMNVPQDAAVPVSPTPTPSITPTSSLTPTPSITATSTLTPTPTNTQTGTPSITTTPTNTTTPTPSPVVLLLDTYPALAAYSTRKLRSAYSGSAIRVVRTSDLAEQDIGFVSNVLDISSLTSFLGVSTGNITKWYNQGSSGSIDDMTQNTLGNQPVIANAGVVYTAGTLNKPVIFWNGVKTLQTSGATTFGSQNNATTFVVGQRTGGSNPAFFVAQNGNYKLNFGTTSCQFDLGGGNVVGNFGTSFNSFNQGTFVRGNSNRTYLKKVETASSPNNTIASNLGTIQVWLGDRNLQDLRLTGYIGEVIIYASNQTANITPISDSQINYYGV